uniref:Trehalose-6-phosphate synthase n=1 Tax=Timema cristinae TaxID=61476 RepID=A0A7R9CY41_TIMCR|nr:unnamed protein product [Timema cristinae]
MPDRANFSSETWRAYVKVNQSFAEKTMEALIRLNKDTTVEDSSSQTSNSTQCPLVWIHDYHLTLAANWVRQSAEDANIKYKLGFFLHIPFPPWDIFRLIPWSDDILQGMLGCDVVGFHIDDYCVNFVDCCQRRLGCRVDRKNLLVEHGGRTVRVRALPIGIPFKRFVTLAENAPKVVTTNQKIILGVDRLDYTKGLVHRLKAFELLLERYPEHLEKVTLLQIAVPSRTDVKEYQDLKEELDQMVGKINGRFTTPNWSPIRYIYGCVGQDQLAAFYRDAAVCLVTPLRDGMNLVAKEFVACQINQPPGVLIVSPFAGAGEMMHEALLCNPYETEEASEVIHRALKMPEDERTLRMNYLRRREKQNDVDQWLRRFLKAMGSTVEGLEDTMPTVMQPVTLDDFNDYLEKYVGNKHKLALLLDYDGTLAPLAHHPDLAVIPPETKNILERLANFPDVYIAIISGRNVNNVKEMVGIEGITYAGNHGLEILHPDGSKFVHPMPVEYENNVKTLLKDLQDKVCKQGAWVENKGALLTFHYRETPVNIRPDMVTQAKKMIKDAGFIAGQAHCAIEAKPPVEWDKGRASLYILRTQFGVDWSERIRIIYVGDDTTDEDAMQMIKDAGFIAGQAHCAIEAKPPVEWDKGRASLYILRTQFGVDWSERIRIIYVGDDTTDEDAMQALKGMAATFRVAASHIVRTVAERRLPNTDAVLTLLKWVERHLHRKDLKQDSSSTLSFKHRSRHGSLMVEMSYDPDSGSNTPTSPDTSLQDAKTQTSTSANPPHPEIHHVKTQTKSGSNDDTN